MQMPYHSKFLRCAALILLGGVLVLLGYFIPSHSATAQQMPVLSQCQGCHQSEAPTFFTPTDPCDECHERTIDRAMVDETNHRLQYLVTHLDDRSHTPPYWTVTTSLSTLSANRSWKVLRLSEALWQIIQTDPTTQHWVRSVSPTLPLLGVLVSLRELRLTVIHSPFYQLPTAQQYWLPLLHAVFTLLALFLVDVSHRRAPPQEESIYQFIQMVKRALGTPFGVYQRSFAV